MTTTARAMLDRAMSEAEWASVVEDALARTGWNYFHPYHAEKSNTILDYIAWRERVIWVELKTMTGKLSVDRMVKGRFIRGQVTVMRELLNAGQEIYLWRPCDFEAMMMVLTRREGEGGCQRSCMLTWSGTTSR